jgi:hypothetical protein
MISLSFFSLIRQWVVFFARSNLATPLFDAYPLYPTAALSAEEIRSLRL